MTGIVAHRKTESWLTLTGQVAHCSADYSTTRRQIDSSLDLLSDNELKIIQGTIDGILKSRKSEK